MITDHLEMDHRWVLWRFVSPPPRLFSPASSGALDHTHTHALTPKQGRMSVTGTLEWASGQASFSLSHSLIFC